MSRQRKNRILKETIKAIIAAGKGTDAAPSPLSPKVAAPDEAQILAYYFGTLTEFEQKRLERQIMQSPESLELLRLFVEISRSEEKEVDEETVKQTTDWIMTLLAQN